MGVSWLQLLANHSKLRACYGHAAAMRAYQSYGCGRIICIANMFGHTTATGLLRARELHRVSARSSYSRVFFQGSFCLQSATMSARLAQKQLRKLCILQLYSKISGMLTAHNINKLCSLGLMINFKSHRGSCTVVLARKGLCQCCANQEHNPSLSSCAEQELHCPDWHWQEVIPRSGSFHGCVTAILRTHCEQWGPRMRSYSRLSSLESLQVPSGRHSVTMNALLPPIIFVR